MKVLNHKSIEMLQFSHLSGECNIFHFITTRKGGNSIGNYSSFNLGEYCGDNSENVRNNRISLCSAFNIPQDKLFVPCQIHGNKIFKPDKSFLSLSPSQQKIFLNGVDALVTDQPEVCIAVTTADCVPILLYACDKKIIAAIHAGWRGTVERIVAKTIHYMVDSYGCDIKQMKAGIGPSIGINAFEVGEEVVEAFKDSGMDITQISERNFKTGKTHVDLWKANQLQLLSEGMDNGNIEIAGICTYSQSDDFFSARKLGIKSGRMLSGIMIKEYDKD